MFRSLAAKSTDYIIFDEIAEESARPTANVAATEEVVDEQERSLRMSTGQVGGMRRKRTSRHVGLTLLALLGSAAPVSAGTLALDLQLTASSSLLAGVVPGKVYRFVYSGSVSGSLTGEFTYVSSMEPETIWWPAAKVDWDSLLISTPGGSLTLSATTARFYRGEASDAAPWSGNATWTVAGGTGSFSGATGRGTLTLTAVTNPAASTNAMTGTLAGNLTVDTTLPTIALNAGTTRAPRLGPNGRLAVEVDVADAAPSSGLRLVEIRGRNIALIAVNAEPSAATAAVPYRQEFLASTAIRRWIVLVESVNALPPDVQVSVSDWAGNSAAASR
jgi:hypothetical protein